MTARLGSRVTTDAWCPGPQVIDMISGGGAMGTGKPKEVVALPASTMAQSAGQAAGMRGGSSGSTRAVRLATVTAEAASAPPVPALTIPRIARGT